MPRENAILSMNVKGSSQGRAHDLWGPEVGPMFSFPRLKKSYRKYAKCTCPKFIVGPFPKRDHRNSRLVAPEEILTNNASQITGNCTSQVFKVA